MGIMYCGWEDTPELALDTLRVATDRLRDCPRVVALAGDESQPAFLGDRAIGIP